jgi:hypothetical protein
MSDKHHHWATIWVPASIDIYGSPTFGTPLKVKCRWEEGDRKYITENGTEAKGRNTIYMNPSYQEYITDGAYLFKGESSASSPPPGSWELKQKRVITNLSGTKSELRIIA